MNRTRSEAIAMWFSRYFPDSFIFALVLTILAMILALVFTDSGPVQILEHWFAGFPWLFEFAFQLIFTYAAALVLVDTPVVQKYVKKMARVIKTPMTAYVITGIFGAVTSFIGWYIGPVVTAIFAREIAKQIDAIDYRLISAISYSSFTISLTGISGTIPLFVATEGKFTKMLGGVIGLDQTTFSTLNIVSCILIVLTTTIIYYVIAKNKKEIVSFRDLAIETNEVAAASEPVMRPSDTKTKEMTFAERIDSFRPILFIIGVFGLFFLILYFMKSGLSGLNLNSVAFIALTIGFLLQKDAVSYANSFAKNLVATGGIALQFPIYGALASMLVGTGLTSKIATLIVQFTNEVTYPVFVFLVSGFVNLFIPSAGSQFTATAPFMIPAAHSLGVEIPRAVMAITYGDIWTNLIQPFWTLLYFPILAAGTRLKVNDFLGYCLPILIAVGIIWGFALVFLPI